MSKKRRQPQDPLSTLAQIRRYVGGELVVTVDPGSEGTGWALWNFYVLPDQQAPYRPDTYGVIKSREPYWRDRTKEIVDRFRDEVLRVYACERMLLEWPAIWIGSEKSQAAAGSGKLIKLAAHCGALQLAASDAIDQDTLFISPNEWKGQLTKKAVDARILRAIGKAYPNHASDAVGMGLAVMGVL